MKKHLIVFLLSSMCAMSMAEDLIVFRSGEVIKGKVEEIGKNSIKYKKVNNLEGPSYTAEKKELLSIQYDNGTVDLLTDPIKVEEENNSSLKFCPQVAVVLATQGKSGVTGGGGVEFIANFKINDHVKMGPGIGMMGHNYNLKVTENAYYEDDFSTFEVPVFFNLQYHFATNNVNPYLQGQVGYNFGNVDSERISIVDNSYSFSNGEEHMGVFFKVGAGINFNLKRGSLFIDLGYKIHQWTVDTTPAYGELTVGYCFRHH